MILMNLTLQYEQAKQHVSKIDFTHGSGVHIPFFEAIIRYLGGLLSAYSLTKEPIFLSKADDIGRALLPAFDTISGIPAFAVDPITKTTLNQEWNGGMTLLSEMVSSVHLSVPLLAKARPNQYTPGFVSA
jgi:mannosyl-oligosaccharide alpha-1,2-mannosidase